jgi:hypothetical protein
MTYQIKNWSQFQHYKSGRGAPPWIKLYRDLLNDPEWFDLPSDAAKFLVSCWILAAETDGMLPASKTIAFRLRLDSKQVDKFLNLCNHWIIQCDSSLLATRYQVAIPETDTETDIEKETEKKTSSRGTRLPLDWKPRPEDGEDQKELEKFRDYWMAVSGQKGVKRDWDATWRNWLRNAKDWSGGSKSKQASADTFRIGHPKGVVKFEPDRPPLSDDQKREREEFVKKTLQNFGH